MINNVSVNYNSQIASLVLCSHMNDTHCMAWLLDKTSVFSAHVLWKYMLQNN